jgi:hypothetical protein
MICHILLMVLCILFFLQVDEARTTYLQEIKPLELWL